MQTYQERILNIAGYLFTPLTALDTWRDYFLSLAACLPFKGTILLSAEGINLNLAGSESAIGELKAALKQQAIFANLIFHETYSAIIPYRKFKVKIKNEIITLRKPQVNAVVKRAKSVSPVKLKQWLDDKRDITLLDTRNDYEIELGSFKQALNLHLQDFSQLPDAIEKLPKDKPIVMFCTGGIRCEKAGLYMEANGYDVYQLDGGILGYFAKVGGAYYEGSCFVFDERIALDSLLMPIA